MYSGANILRAAYNFLMEEYTSFVSNKTSTSITVLCVVMPISTLLIVVVVAALYIRSLKATKKERCNVLHLFLAIPKNAILSTLYIYKKEGETMDDDIPVSFFFFVSY